ncbi:hypothetical protein NKG94_22380 [Micromonospora sp. M12]
MPEHREAVRAGDRVAVRRQHADADVDVSECRPDTGHRGDGGDRVGGQRDALAVADLGGLVQPERLLSTEDHRRPE